MNPDAMSTNLPRDDKPVWTDVSVNSQALSLFRILFACLLLLDLFAYVLPHWEFLYGSHGAFMAQERNTDLFWSLLSYSDNPLFQFSIVGVYVLALLGFLLGYRTRLCAFVAFLGLKMMLDRNPAAISNAEGLESWLLLWCAFMPMDRYWSVAAASRGSEPRNDRWPLIPVIALKGQILLVYFCSGVFKLASEPWLSGKAISYTVSDDFYGSAAGHAVSQTLPPALMVLACWAIIALQVLFSALVYARVRGHATRIIALAGAAAMHIGFIFFMQLFLFPFLCLFYLILLFPDQWITRALKKRRARLEKIRIYYDPGCTFCRRTAFILKEFCLSPFTPVLPADAKQEAHALLQKNNSWIVYGAEGEVYMKWRAVSYVLKRSPVFFILGYLTDLPPVRPLMEKCYHLIGRNRNRLGRLSAPLLAEQRDSYPDRTQQLICLFLSAIAVSYTIWALPQIEAPIPNGLYSAARQTGVIQTWDLFAPSTVAYDREIKVTAFDDKGKPISLEPFTRRHFEVENGYYDFSSPRILKYYAAMFPRNSPRHREGYARYMCWQTYHAGIPASRVKLQLNIQHNFIPEDKYGVTRTYMCRSLMR